MKHLTPADRAALNARQKERQWTRQQLAYMETERRRREFIRTLGKKIDRKQKQVKG